MCHTIYLWIVCEPASEEVSVWDDGHANWLVAVCGVWSEHWQADLLLLQPLKQCWQHTCVCFFEASFCTWLSTRTQHLWSTLVRPVLSETRLGKPLSLATSLSGCYRISYKPNPSLWRATIQILKSSESSLPWDATLNIQWPVWENCTQITKFELL